MSHSSSISETTYDAFYQEVKINHAYISVTVMYLSVSIGSYMTRFNCIRCIYDSMALWISGVRDHRTDAHLCVTTVDYVKWSMILPNRFHHLVAMFILVFQCQDCYHYIFSFNSNCLSTI